MYVFISCESENPLTARYTISQYLYHSLLSEANLSQHTFSIILCRDKVPKNWTWPKGYKWTIQAFHVYGFQLTNADCQASKGHCKIVSAQAENTIPTLEKGLVSIYVCVLIAVHIPALESKRPTLRVQFWSHLDHCPLLTLDSYCWWASFTNPSHISERNWWLPNAMCISISISKSKRIWNPQPCLLKS